MWPIFFDNQAFGPPLVHNHSVYSYGNCFVIQFQQLWAHISFIRNFVISKSELWTLNLQLRNLNFATLDFVRDFAIWTLQLYFVRNFAIATMDFVHNFELCNSTLFATLKTLDFVRNFAIWTLNLIWPRIDAILNMA